MGKAENPGKQHFLFPQCFRKAYSYMASKVVLWLRDKEKKNQLLKSQKRPTREVFVYKIKNHLYHLKIWRLLCLYG